MSVSGNDIIKNITSRLGKNGSHVWNYYGLAKGTAWCAAEVSYTLDKVGLKSKFYGGKPVFYVPYAQQWLHNNAKIIYELGSGSLANAQPGDIIIFTWGNKSRDHIGFCRCKGSSTSMNTIEGNTNGGKVANKTRAKKYIYGVYRLKGITNEPYDYSLKVDGDWGTSTTISTQHIFGLEEDGVMGKQTWSAIQKKVGATVDGEAGTDTYTHMAQFLGICGKNTQVNRLTTDLVKAWQKWINEQIKPSATTTKTTTSTTKKKYSGELPNTTVTVTGTCKIGQATSDERGKTKGGKVGDQTHGEVGISKYSYSSKSGVYNHWQFVVRIKSDEGKAKAVKCMKQLCANNNIGYNQKPAGGRSALYKKLKAVNFDGSKVGKVDTSCTPLVEACLRAGGVPIATGSDAAHFKAAAQKCTSKVDILTASKYLTSSKYLKAGDALCSGKHSAMVVQASTSTRHYLKKGDKGTEVGKLQKFLKWYGYSISVDKDFGSATESAVKKFQKANGLEVDGLWGTACNKKAKEVMK